jgi:signal transduction histidine kinase
MLGAIWKRSNRQGGGDAAGTAATPGLHWPRVRLIYFGLAAVDVTAIAASLYLGFTMLATFEKGAGRNLSFDRQAVSLAAFAAAFSETHSLVVSSVFQERSAATVADLRVKSANFRREFQQFRQQLQQSATASTLVRINPLLTRIETGYNSMEDLALRALDSRAAGDQAAAVRLFNQLQARYVTLQLLIRDIGQKVNLLRKSANEQDLAVARGIQHFEYLIAGLLALIILGIVGYGHFIGRLMRGKYLEIAEANRKLAESNAEIQENSARLEAINRDIEALNRQMHENLVKLRDAQDELVRKGKMAQLGQLTATVAHELRNPMGAVRTSAFLLERKLKGSGLGIEPQIERINNGIMRCDHIISQLLDFARTKSIQPESLDFDAWLTGLVEEEAQRLPAPIAIECRLGIGGREVPLDPARMGRAIVNLLGNAAEAMVGRGADGARLAVRDPTITISTRLGERGAEVEIADNGPGIPPEHLEKIFEPLFTTKNFGTGLGLPAVQKIMEQHGGGLEVRSAPGQGASFTLWWPLTQSLREAS